MSRHRNIPGWAKIVGGLLLLGAASTACDEDSKTAPEKCGTPPLLIYDIQQGAEDGAAGANPGVTKVGHAVSQILPPTPSGGNATGGNATGGTAANGGNSGKGGSGGKSGSAGKGGNVGNGGGAGGAGGA